ncbi:MAG: FHA domain-containing protein [bacterium]|nr:FHA domain-containing protein [bacterium]
MADKGSKTNEMIRIEVAGQAVRLEDLLRERYSLGRGDPDGELHVDFKIVGDDFLSRHHFSLVRDGDGYVLENESPNGTQVNGKTIDDTRRLKNKDKIAVGKQTAIQYLVLSAEERAAQYKALADSASDKTQETDEEQRSLVQKPVFWVVIAFYAILGLVIMGALSSTKETAPDPGQGPYFEHLISDPLEVASIPEGARELAVTMWKRATDKHAGQFAGREGHDYRLAHSARDALGVLGHSTVKDALANEEEIAQVLVTLVGNLESRIGELYTKANAQIKAGRGSLAVKSLEAIEEAVPDRELPIRKYAKYWITRLKR